MPKVFKMKSVQYILQNLKKELKLMFCVLINMKVFYKLIVLLLMDFARHVLSTRASLRFLCDILRKKLGIKLGT